MRLEMGLGTKQVQTQTMILAPRMIQSMEILQLPIMALQEKIQQELLENPFLELAENAEEAGDPPAKVEGAEPEEVEAPAPADDGRDPGAGELVIDETGSNELDFDRLDALSRDWEDHFNEEHRPSRSGLEEEGDKKHDAMQNMASPPQSLQEYLSDQLAFFELPARQLALVRYLISFIDDNGFLSVPDESAIAQVLAVELEEARKKAAEKTKPPKPEDLEEEFKEIEDRVRKSIPRRCPSLEELAQGCPEPVGVPELEEALHVVQRLDPPGVGARTLKECLLLQLTPETPHRDVLRKLIQNHLEDIQHNRLPAIQKETSFSLPLIKEAIEALKHLNPRPGAQFVAENIPYVVPDILVERTDEGDYEIRLLDDWLPKIYMSKRYIELYKEKGSDPETREYLKRKIQAAQWLQESIEQRRNTLEKVTRAIIQHQRAFLDKGPEHIQPLKMQQIADQVGVHVTTVSRAVDDKWVQTPRGIFPLKRFFGGGKKAKPEGSDSEELVAWEVIKQKLLELIDQEDKSNPLSDEDLVARLNEAGYPVARRTVTKYRKMAGIPSSRQRKDWTAVSTPSS
jgi:RNA polymerase sigma-54 factor